MSKTRVPVYYYQSGPSKYFYSIIYQIPDTTKDCGRLSEEEALDKASGARKEAEIGVASFYYTLPIEEREKKRSRYNGNLQKVPRQGLGQARKTWACKKENDIATILIMAHLLSTSLHYREDWALTDSGLHRPAVSNPVSEGLASFSNNYNRHLVLIYD